MRLRPLFPVTLLIASAIAQQASAPPALPSEDGSLLCTGTAYHDKALGKTTLLFDVDETGATRNVRVATPFRKDLDERALKAASQLHFTPAKKKSGAPAAVTVSKDVTFDCREKPVTLENGITPPKPLESPKPAASPSSAQLDRLARSTVLEIIVNTDGTVGPAMVAKSCGDKDLDRKALEAVRQWKFTPAMKGGHPVKVLLNVLVDFRSN